MTPKEFIGKRLQELQLHTETVNNFKSDKDLAEFIFNTVMSKKFRKFAVTPEYIPNIKWAIENSIENNLPIKFVFPFGGYKLWRLEETPEVDWAELFTFMYFAKWLKPISEVYKPGIWFDFNSDDVVVERMNNISKSDTESYARSFNLTIKFLEKYLPNNMKFTFTPVSSLYTSEEFEEDLKDKIEMTRKEHGGLPILDDKHRRMVELNVRLKPGQDTDPEWREKIELIHKAYMAVSKRRPYNRAKEKILVFCTKMANCVPVGVTKTSVAKFWVGIGALKKTEDGYQEYVLSPSQIESSNLRKEDISIKGLDSKNFKTLKLISN